MPSPFPGMDPFIEGPNWPDFHHGLIAAIAEQLVPLVRPGYLVRRERRVYFERLLEDDERQGISDVTLIRDESLPVAPRSHRQSAPGASAIAPVSVALPAPEEVREAYIVLRHADSNEIVTWIEVLSPTNKRPGSTGRGLYLEKREELLASTVNLVEIDLLRGGERLPTAERPPEGDFYVFVRGGDRRYRADVYAWTLRQHLPRIDVPLAKGDGAVPLDLQQAFTTTYDRAGYDYSLDYHGDVVPLLDPNYAAWVDEVLRERESDK